MRRVLVAMVIFAALNLGGCTHYHQEVAALRMVRPAAEPGELSAYAGRDTSYPSVGGDIVAGAAPRSAAAYEATSGERVPPPDTPRQVSP
ncbi:MAG TPA: hypothetical protein VN694_06665 [Caulobacteraceae bacterium]|nr:hypothetical protein [Caulobacteraceae bacterium]